MSHWRRDLPEPRFLHAVLASSIRKPDHPARCVCRLRQRGADAPLLEPPARSERALSELELAIEGPLSPSDPTLFSPLYYPGSPAFAPADGAELSKEAAVARAVTLAEGHDPARVEAARAVFDDPAISSIVPDHALRAGLASLTGTLAEPVIGWVARSFARIEFGTPGDGDAAKSLEVAGEQVIIVDEGLRFEDPGLLGPLLAHEALHSDAAVSDHEELVAFAIQALVHMEQIVADPSLATERTELAQRMNPWVLARLNTRVPGSSDLRLVLPDFAPSVFPGGINVPYFAVPFDPTAESTAGTRCSTSLPRTSPTRRPMRQASSTSRSRRSNSSMPARTPSPWTS